MALGALGYPDALPGTLLGQQMAAPGALVVQPGQQIVPITARTEHLGPDTTSGFDRVEETEKMSKQRIAAEDAAKRQVEAEKAAALGAMPSQAEAAQAPIVQAPIAAPTGEGLTGGIPQRATMPEQQDANKLALDALAKQQADDRASDEARLNSIAKQRSDEALANMERAGVEHSKATSALATKEDKGFLHNVLSALAQAAGAYGSAMTGSPNFAARIIENAEKGEFERKKANIDATYEKYKAAGARLKDVDPWLDRERGRLLAQQKTRLDQLKSGADVALSRFPKVQMEINATLEKKNADLEAQRMAWAKDTGLVKRSYEERKVAPVESVTTPKDGGVSATHPPAFDKTLALHGRIVTRAIDDITKRPQPSQQAMEKAQDNESFLLAAVNEAKTTGGAMKQYVLRKLDVMPRTSTEGLSNSDQIYLNNMQRINTSFLRITSGAAIKDDEFIRQADELLLRSSDSKDLREFKLQEMRNITNDLVALSGPGVNKLLDNQPASGSKPPTEAPKPFSIKVNMRGLDEGQKKAVTNDVKTLADPKSSPEAKQEAQSRIDQINQRAPAKTPTNTQLLRVRDMVGEARKVKKDDPDYVEAQSLIKKAEAKYGKAVQ
jgi:hypothetical protein